MRRKLIDLMGQRTALVEQAEAALKAGKREDYASAMEKVRNMNTEIQEVQDLIAEQDRKFMERPRTPPRSGTRPRSGAAL